MVCREGFQKLNMSKAKAISCLDFFLEYLYYTAYCNWQHDILVIYLLDESHIG